MSAATTSPGAELIASIALAAGSRGSPEKPVPKIASTITVAPSRAAPSSPAATSRSSTCETSSRRSRFAFASPESSSAGQSSRVVHLETGAGEQARRDQAVAAVVALPADDGDLARACQLGGHLGHGLAGGLHQVERGNPAGLDRPGVDRPHPLGVEAGGEPVLHGAEPRTIEGGRAEGCRSGGCERHGGRRVARVRQRDRPPRARPPPARPRRCSRTVGGSPATISICDGPSPGPGSALITASLAANLAARCRPGPGPLVGVGELGGREQPLAQARAALQGALDPLDLDDVDAQAWRRLAGAATGYFRPMTKRAVARSSSEPEPTARKSSESM